MSQEDIYRLRFKEKCSECKGSGEKLISLVENVMGAYDVNIIPCSKCGGTGEITRKTCKFCDLPFDLCMCNELAKEQKRVKCRNNNI